jgi:hypothetical protein
VRSLERADGNTLTIAAGEPPFTRDHAEHLPNSRFMLADEAAWIQVQKTVRPVSVDPMIGDRTKSLSNRVM